METNGAYTIQLPSATFFVTVFSEDYIPELWAPEGSVRDCADAQQIEISEGSPVAGIDFQLAPGNVIFGTVYEPGGTAPLVNQEYLGIENTNQLIIEFTDDSGSMRVRIDSTEVDHVIYDTFTGGFSNSKWDILSYE